MRKNKTYKGKPTKSMIKKQRYLLIACVVWVVSGWLTHTGYMTGKAIATDAQIAGVTIQQKTIDQPAEPETSESNGTIREVTAYNVGDPAQTDSTPCIGASGIDLCEALARGEKHCATNFVPLGTVIEIQNFGECVVSDRMNSRFANRVDVAMKLSEKDRAIKFGLQNLLVTVK